MQYTVHIKPDGFNLKVQSGETVLSAALRAGYQFPHDCQNGVCGTCKGQLLEGQVTYDDPILPALSEEERESGYALFCSAKPVSDLVIFINGVLSPACLPVKKLIYTVESLEQITPTIYKAILKPSTEDYILYRAGQYIEILHKDTSPFPFSIANAPLGDDKSLEIHIRYHPDNTYTAELLAQMQSTGLVKIKGPFGNSILHKEPAYPIIFAAGGTGIAPLKALLEQALAEGLQQPLYLYWGARIINDFYLNDLVARWEKYIPNFHYIPILSGKEDQARWKGRSGWVHDAIIQDHPHLENFQIYASGPTEMVYAALHTFKIHGLNRALMYSDALDYPAS